MNTETITPVGTVSPDGGYVFTGEEWLPRQKAAPATASRRNGARTLAWIGIGAVTGAVLVGAIVSNPEFQAGFDAGVAQTSGSERLAASQDAAQTAAPSAQDIESEFVSVVRSHGGPMNVSDADLIYHGRSACQRLSAGVEFPTVVNTKAMFLGEFNAATTVSAAVGWLCPEHRAQAMYYMGG